MRIFLLLLSLPALFLTSCCCGGSGSTAGFPKHTGPHGDVTMEATVTR